MSKGFLKQIHFLDKKKLRTVTTTELLENFNGADLFPKELNKSFFTKANSRAHNKR